MVLVLCGGVGGGVGIGVGDGWSNSSWLERGDVGGESTNVVACESLSLSNGLSLWYGR